MRHPLIRRPPRQEYCTAIAMKLFNIAHSRIDHHGRSAVNISSFANGALGEHRRQDTDGTRLEIDAPGCRSRVRRSIALTCWHAGQENVSHGTPAAIAAPMVG